MLLLLGYAIRRAVRERDAWWPILVFAPGIAVFMEPFPCLMVEAHHPAIGAYVLMRGLGGTVPLQLLFVYMAYFAPAGIYLVHRARRGVTVGQYGLDFGLTYLLLSGAEAVAMSLKLWSFFGNNPFVVPGLPLWVALTNIAAVYAWATAGAHCLDRLKGRQRYWALVAGPFAAVAINAPIRLPTAIALFSGAGYTTTVPVGLVSVALGLLTIAGACHLLLAIEAPSPNERRALSRRGPHREQHRRMRSDAARLIHGMST